MNRLHHEIIGPLQRALQAIQQEIHLLEQDLGLCADCGERPPVPFEQRTASRVRRHTFGTPPGRRVA
jgi:hypothetical protein